MFVIMPPRQRAPRTAPDDLTAWFTGRLPDDWFEGPPVVTGDRDEILVVGDLPDVELEGRPPANARAAARRARIDRFREETRSRRMAIAKEAEHHFGRSVSWGATCGGERTLFTSLSVPVMTRLRMDERVVLDTLVQAGVARSRSHALAWCVRLVGRNQGEWIKELQKALVQVGEVRAGGPEA